MTPCVQFDGKLDRHGYGALMWRGKWSAAHRVAYEAIYGPIPHGLVIDHICHNADPSCPGGKSCLHRSCVNVDHLEVVTIGVNVLRGKTIPAAHLANPICLTCGTPKVMTSEGYRRCLPCRRRSCREAARRYRAKQKVTG